MNKSGLQLKRFKITPKNDVYLGDFHQHEHGSLFIPTLGNLSMYLKEQ